MLLNLFHLSLAYIHLVTMLASLFHLRVPFLSMEKLKQVSFCSFGLTKSFANNRPMQNALQIIST